LDYKMKKVDSGRKPVKRRNLGERRIVGDFDQKEYDLKGGALGGRVEVERV